MLKNYKLFIPFALLSLTSPLFSTVYENAENASTSNWTIYDNKPSGATIKNIFDVKRNSRIIKLTGEGRNNSYLIGAKKGTKAWNNSREKNLQWKMKFSEKFKISIYVNTTKGERVLYYSPHNYDKGIYKKKYLRFGLGEQTQNGSWHKISRNIERDIQRYEPKNKLLSINGMKIQGSGKIDNIELLAHGNLNKKSKVYFNGDKGTTKGWSIINNNASQASMTNIYDNEKKSKVIKLQGDNRNTAYKLGDKTGSKRWKNSAFKTISWSMKTNEKYKVVVYTETKKGLRYFYFTSKEISQGLLDKKYIHIGLERESRNNHWQTFTFNLERLLKEHDSGNTLQRINGFKVIGSGYYDDIQLLNKNKHSKFFSKEKLGKALYNDTSLSKNRTMSCATCHSKNVGFIDKRKSTVGHMAAASADEKFIADRNVPTNSYASLIPDFHREKEEGKIIYVGGNFLDGTAKDLKAQAKGPFLNPIEMQMPNAKAVVKRVKENPKYIKALKNLYSKNIFNNTKKAYDAIADAIASFERTKEFSPFNSKYDRVLKGKDTFTAQEQEGLALFSNKGKCAECHPLGNFTDYTYDNLGIPANLALRKVNGKPADFIDHGLLGNPKVTNKEFDGHFRVSSLRNIEVTSPYMHNGLFKDLKTVVHFYNTRDVKGAINPETHKTWRKAEVPETTDNDEVGNLGLSDSEEDAIVAFIKTLTDKRYEK